MMLMAVIVLVMMVTIMLMIAMIRHAGDLAGTEDGKRKRVIGKKRGTKQENKCVAAGN